MNIVVCCKWVYEPNTLTVRPDGSVSAERARYALSEYDRNAIEAAMRLAEPDDHVSVLTFGPKGVVKLVKDALARGPEAGYCVVDPRADSDGITVRGAIGAATAKVLAAGLQKIENVQIVVCAEGSADVYAHEVGPRLATLLGWPLLSHLASVARTEVGGLAGIEGRRVVDGLDEWLSARLPAVVTVLPAAAPAPIPGLKAVLAAGRRPVTEVPLLELGLEESELTPRTVPRPMVANLVHRKHVVLDGASADELAQELIDRLVVEGVLR